jgi:hypothetical protein
MKILGDSALYVVARYNIQHATTNQIHLAAAIVGSCAAGQLVGLVSVNPLPPFLGVQPATVPTARQSVRGAAVGLPASVQEAHGSVFGNRSALGLVLPFFFVLSVSGAFGAACAAPLSAHRPEAVTICRRGSHRIAVGEPRRGAPAKPPAHELFSFPQPRQR